ncbi:hypothetical protein NMG29_39795 [Streptomyces cocklensis]|uniref:Uncharacterized protein n=1 Tax=Actinacidiphila cocklensis TaxID=887465 RepID=A0A9W4GVV6_9ACTN|nr:hypothetical protein [Actinacidiphila cocklensis]MDD1064208.1 hypothetical protein [Actinacidiphila cocklensis]CAG6398666.1 conserved hypothetical protein [Actinacidiphila cocklensis]
MASFLTHRQLVLDRTLPVRRRHAALRTCLTLYAPYGFRATYHHLTVSAAIPRDLDADPESLERAVNELHEARVLRMAEDARYAERRRCEKHAGQRVPRRPGTWWHRHGRQSCYQLDPLCHPALALPEFIRRQISLANGEALPGCADCGSRRPANSRSTGHGFIDLCRSCGAVQRSCACGRPHHLHPLERDLWPRLWRREHMTHDGLPNPHWPGTVEDRIAGLQLRSLSQPRNGRLG